MKRLLIYMGLFVAIGISTIGCYKDVIVPQLASDPDGPPQPVSFKNDIAPVLNTNCAVTGCHVSGGHHPYMSTDISYLQIVNGGFVNTLLPKESILYKMVYGEMGVYLPSAADKQKIYDWIRNGAPNN